MSTSGTLPSLESSTPDNDGPTVVLIAYLFLVLTIIAIIARLAASLSKKRTLELEDGLLTVATIISLAQTVLTERAVDTGLGRFMNKLDANQINSYYKLIYASEILSIFPMALAKLSVISLVRRIPGDKSMNTPCFIANIVILAWTLFSLIALLLECGADHPWIYKPQKCAGGIWYAVVSLNIISDAMLSFFFAPTLWKLQTSRSKRVKVISLFAVRVLVCIAGIVQMTFLPSTLSDDDQTRARVKFTILNQLVMTLSIITAAVPSLYRSVANMHSDMGLQIPESHLEMYNSGSKGQGKTTVKALDSSSKGFSFNRSKHRSQAGGRGGKGHNTTASESEEHFPSTEETKTNGRIEHDPGFNAETGSHASDGSEQMIIRQTRAWDVRYEEEN